MNNAPSTPQTRRGWIPVLVTGIQPDRVCGPKRLFKDDAIKKYPPFFPRPQNLRYNTSVLLSATPQGVAARRGRCCPWEEDAKGYVRQVLQIGTDMMLVMLLGGERFSYAL